MLNRHHKVLELDKVLELLASYCSVADAKALARSLEPARALYEAAALVNQTSAAYVLMARYGAPSFGAIKNVNSALSRAADGNPVDVNFESRSGIPAELSAGIIVGVPLLVSFGACEGMRHRMKPVKTQSRADEYIVPGGIHFNLKRDVFVNRTVSRTVIRTENRDSHYGGGGGTTVNSGGFSGHSGKF